MSRAVLDAKLREIAVTGAAIVATSNPGCTMQIESGARRSGVRLDVRHVIELLDQSYRADGGEPETGAGQRPVLRAP
jgi:glycolate oxidase iron-sulfur subunit